MTGKKVAETRKNRNTPTSSILIHASYRALTNCTPQDTSITPRPLELVSVEKNDDGRDTFKFHKDNLELVMKQVPLGTPVAMVSVVGAFRSGKSSLMSWFLRSLEEM